MRAYKRKSNGVKKLYIFFIPIIFLLFVNFSLTAEASGTKFNEGLKVTGQGAGYPVEAANNPGNFLAKMFGSVLTPMFMGVIAMLILGYAGYTWMTARGEEQKIEKAKDMIKNTIFALVVAFSAYAILKLIIPLWEFVTK
ncbi:MAG: hypothetical protein Q7K35_02775 [bacterium]|nr:hypothetical protein [bacterium]